MEYFISTDKTKLDIEKIHNYISKESYWAMERTMEQTQSTIKNCLCFGMYSKSNEQLAFVRFVTDHVFFGYIMDFIVFPEHQGQGFGKKFMEFIMKYEVVKNLNTIGLKTKDAQGFYKQFGFEKIGDSELWMANDRQILS